MNPVAACPIPVIMAACHARREAVINAARISGIPIRGNLLGGDVRKFSLDFFGLVFDEEKMLAASEQRRKSGAATA